MKIFSKTLLRTAQAASLGSWIIGSATLCKNGFLHAGSGRGWWGWGWGKEKEEKDVPGFSGSPDDTPPSGVDLRIYVVRLFKNGGGEKRVIFFYYFDPSKFPYLFERLYYRRRLSKQNAYRDGSPTDTLLYDGQMTVFFTLSTIFLFFYFITLHCTLSIGMRTIKTQK